MQLPSTSLHLKRVPEEYQIPDDLTEVVAAWPSLSDDQKAQVLAIIGGRIA